MKVCSIIPILQSAGSTSGLVVKESAISGPTTVRVQLVTRELMMMMIEWLVLLDGYDDGGGDGWLVS